MEPSSGNEIDVETQWLRFQLKGAISANFLPTTDVSSMFCGRPSGATTQNHYLRRVFTGLKPDVPGL